MGCRPLSVPCPCTHAFSRPAGLQVSHCYIPNIPESWVFPLLCISFNKWSKGIFLEFCFVNLNIKDQLKIMTLIRHCCLPWRYSFCWGMQIYLTLLSGTRHYTILDGTFVDRAYQALNIKSKICLKKPHRVPAVPNATLCKKMTWIQGFSGKMASCFKTCILTSITISSRFTCSRSCSWLTAVSPGNFGSSWSLSCVVLPPHNRKCDLYVK